jgi:ABC-type molybdate transport system substrate-binding protein
VHVFPTAPGLIQPQLGRDVQIDIVVTQAAALDRLAGSGLLAGDARSGMWRDRLVIAERDGAAGEAGSGSFAVSELPAASGIDGADIAERLGVAPASRISAIDTEEVAFLLVSGAARSGLLFLTDVRADPRLRVIRPVEVAPVMFAAAVTKGASRPDPAAFVRFLDTPRVAQALSDSGLEASA